MIANLLVFHNVYEYKMTLLEWTYKFPIFSENAEEANMNNKLI